MTPIFLSHPKRLLSFHNIIPSHSSQSVFRHAARSVQLCFARFEKCLFAQQKSCCRFWFSYFSGKPCFSIDCFPKIVLLSITFFGLALVSASRLFLLGIRSAASSRNQTRLSLRASVLRAKQSPRRPGDCFAEERLAVTLAKDLRARCKC